MQTTSRSTAEPRYEAGPPESRLSRAAARRSAVAGRQRGERRVEGGEPARGEPRREVAQLVRVGPEVVVLALAVRVFEVRAVREAKRLVRGRIAAAGLGRVGIVRCDIGAVVLDEGGVAPGRDGTSSQQRQEALAVDARRNGCTGEPDEGGVKVDVLRDAVDGRARR